MHNAFYIGSTKCMTERWPNHRSDFRLKNSCKCGLSKHAATHNHPEILLRQAVPFLKVVFLESVKNDSDLLKREVYWQLNFGTLSNTKTQNFIPLNDRKDFNAVN